MSTSNYFIRSTFQNLNSDHHNHGKFWNCEERQYLIQAMRMGVRPSVISKTLGRSRNSIAMKLVEMGY